MEPPQEPDWEDDKRRVQLGVRVRGTVKYHAPFGILVDIGDPVVMGLVQITDFLDHGRMTPEQYPPIGSEVEAVTLGFTDGWRKQVWMSMKPSRLQDAV